MVIKRVFLFGFILWCSLIKICPDIEIYSRKQAVQLAMEHSPVIAIRDYAERATQAQTQAQISSFLPQIRSTVTSEYTNAAGFGFSPVSSGAFSGLEKAANENYGYQAELTQYLFGFGQLQNSLRLKKRINAKEYLASKIAFRELVRNVNLALTQALLAQANVQIAEKRQFQRKDEWENVSSRYQLGKATVIELRQAESHFKQAEQDLIRYQSLLDLSLLSLGKAFGQDTPVMLSANIKLKRSKKMNHLFEHVEKILDKTLEIQDIENSIMQSYYSEKIVKSGYWPNARFFTNTYGFGEDQEQMTDPFWSVGIRFSWDVFSGGQKYFSKKSEHADRLKIFETLQMQQLEDHEKYAALKKKWHAIDQMILLQKQTVVLAQKNYEDSNAMYKIGTLSWLELKDVSLALAESEYQLNILIAEEWNIVTDLLAFMTR